MNYKKGNEVYFGDPPYVYKVIDVKTVLGETMLQIRHNYGHNDVETRVVNEKDVVKVTAASTKLRDELVSLRSGKILREVEKKWQQLLWAR